MVVTKLRILSVLTAIGVSGSLLAPARAEQHQNANVYAYWDFSGRSGFWNVDQELRVPVKASASYWASNWAWTDASYGGYVGIQTDGNRADGSTGDTAIFSIWNANGGGPGCMRFSGEGTGMSCRLAYPIQTDRYYRLRIWRLDADDQGQWWGAWILDEATGVESFIGKLRAAGRGQHTLMAPPMNFSEYFGTKVSCDAVPVSWAIWTQPAANHRGGGVYEYGSHTAGSHRGDCTGGGVYPLDLPTKGTRGVWIIQGGAR